MRENIKVNVNLAGFKNAAKLQKTNIKRMRQQSMKLRKPNNGFLMMGKNQNTPNTQDDGENDEINYADYYEGLSNTQIKQDQMLSYLEDDVYLSTIFNSQLEHQERMVESSDYIYHDDNS